MTVETLKHSATPPPSRSWWRGFTARIMFSISALALILILVTSAVSYDALRDTTLNVAAQNLDGRANTLRHDLETRVNHMAASLKELSANNLFANALTDDIGRNVYLRDFLDGYTLIEGFDVTIAMTNFRGVPVVFNMPNKSLMVPREMIAQAVDASQRAGRVVLTETSPYLVIVEPVIYRNTGMAEGALVMQVNISDWLQSETVNSVFDESPWLSSLFIEHRDVTEHTAASMVAGRGVEDPVAPQTRQLIRMPPFIEGAALAIHLSAKQRFIQEPLDDLLAQVSLVSLAVFIAAVMGGFFLSKSLTRKLERLRDEALQVKEAKFRNISFTSDGMDEIDDLAEAYTTLFDALQDAYRQLEDDSQREIELRERHYKSIVDNSAEGIITISGNGVIETFNPSAEHIFGYAADEVIGRNVSLLMPQEERAAHDGYLDKSHLHAPRIINRSRDLTGLRKNGSTFPLELNVSPMEINGEQKYIGIMRDISERKEFEDRINAARIEAEQANQAKSQFLSSMSHELRTPLNAILGFGQLLEMDGKNPLDGGQKEAVYQILKGGNHLLELVDQVLNLAKIENGNLTVSIEPIEVAPLLNDALNMAQSMADKRNVTIKTDFPEEDGARIFADRTRLQQVLLNLLSNAIKYNVPDGTATLSYRVRRDAHVCRFEVSDTGRGIPEHLHDKVFQPFNRLGAEGSDIEGTGIGLTITRELVRMMDGEIGFDSTPRKGSTFWFELPLAEDNAASLNAAVESAGDHTRSATEGQPRTVLYVEDNPSNQQLMEMLFSQRPDLQLISAHTAEIGLAKAESENPELVLMDINLPGMNGIEALHALHANAKTADIPVIAISANAMPREVEDAMKEGFVDYLTKPLDLAEAMRAIDKALDGA